MMVTCLLHTITPTDCERGFKMPMGAFEGVGCVPSLDNAQTYETRDIENTCI